MRRFHSRPYFFITGLLVAVAACSDSGSISAPGEGVPTLDHRSSTPGDTATKSGPTSPATPAPPSDTGTTTPPPPSTPSTPSDSTPTTPPFVPSATIDLSVTVGAAVAGKDTLAFTPVANAKVTVFSRTLVPTPGAGADSLKLVEGVVANSTTDASGKAHFDGLPAVSYRVEAVQGGRSTSVAIAGPYSRDVGITLILK